MSTVLFCPVRERPDVLSLVLESHAALKGISQFWYVDDNEDQESSKLLEETKHFTQAAKIIPASSIVGEMKATYRNHEWGPQEFTRISIIRDWALRTFQRRGYSHLMMVDADLVLHPDTVQQLVAQEKPVISEVFWSQWPLAPVVKHLRDVTDRDRTPWQPNVWDYHPYTFADLAGMVKLREPGRVAAVGGLGACTLIRKEAVRHLSYAPIPNVLMGGEDRHFCIRAAVHGIGLYADTSYPPFHVYRPDEQLAEARAWWENGADPDYFRRNWLTEQWKYQITGKMPEEAA